MSEEEMMIKDINENCYELYSEEYVEQLQQELEKQKQEKDMIEFNFDKQIKENKVDYELKLIKANELLDKSIKTITTLEQKLKDKDEKISEIIEYIKENIKAELLNGSIWIDKCKLLNILESNKED